MEDWVLRFENIGMAGPNYAMFIPARNRPRPVTLNTRVYSCNLIRNTLPFRWRGRFYEDTILSLDILKAGWVTVIFNTLLQEKLPTQTLPGGNTSELYHAEDAPKDGQSYSRTGTVEKSKMLVREHPDVARVVFKFGRYHHTVNYARFKQRPIPIPDCVLPESPDNYGMKLVVNETA